MEADYHKKFIKAFEKLHPKIKSKFLERLEIFKVNPFSPVLNNHSVAPEYAGWRSIDITGDYRALFEMIDENAVKFMRIGTHSQLYKK